MATEPAEPILPGALLQAIASRNGRVTLIVGAGCSLEAPTDLKLSREYAELAFEQLVANGMLDLDDCADPSDLSLLASAVMARHQSQAPLVREFPHNDFMFAKANLGYLLAAALMAEGAVAYVATLNFDMALSDAISEVRPEGVTEVAGPASLWTFGNKAIIYLHRNVREPDAEKWILRSEAIETEWEDGWESVVAGRLVAAPVVVFAGLGSPAGALTETLSRVRAKVPDATSAYVVDPAEESQFSMELQLDPANHIRTGWGSFMSRLADRVARQFILDLRMACGEFAGEHDCGGLDGLDRILEALEGRGLLGIGGVRSRWLGQSRRYVPDIPAYRPHLADLSLGVASLLNTPDAQVEVLSNGVVTLARPGHPDCSVYPISGLGQRHWATLDPLIASWQVERGSVPNVVLASAYRGTEPANLRPPPDITGEAQAHDVAGATPKPILIELDELRNNPDLLTAAGF